MRSAHLSLIDLRARIPSTSSGSSWSACARDSSSWSRPLASLSASATASSSSRRSTFSSWPNICLPPSLNGRVAQHRSRSAQRKPHRQRSCAHIGRKRHGKAVRPDSCRGAATREPASVPATTSSPIPAGAQQPPMGRIPCPEGLGAHAGFHAARLRPFDPNTRPGAPWTRRVARRQAASKGRDTFSGSSPHALRARTTRKTAVGRLLFPCPTSLPPLQARLRCMRLTRRKARHRGGPQSLRSKT